MTFNQTARSIAAGAAAALTAGCMTQPSDPQLAAAGQRQCFLASQVHGFHAVDDDTVHVFVGANDVYSLELLGVCTDVDWSTRIGIRSTGGSSFICRGHDAELLVPSPTGTNRCVVTDIQQLDEDAARAIRSTRGS